MDNLINKWFYIPDFYAFEINTDDSFRINPRKGKTDFCGFLKKIDKINDFSNSFSFLVILYQPCDETNIKAITISEKYKDKIFTADTKEEIEKLRDVIRGVGCDDI